MPGPILHAGASGMCPHGGSLNIIATNARVTVSGMPVAVITDQGVIAGCAFTVPPSKPQPCVSVQWIQGASRVTADGKPVLISPPMAICQSAEKIPGGPPNFVSTQTRVIAT